MSDHTSKAINVAVGLLLRAGRVLVTRRNSKASFALQWEYPGGKVEAGESPRETVQRELREELTVVASTTVLLFEKINAFPSGKSYHVHYFIVPEFTGIPHSQVADSAAWIPLEQLASFPLLDASGAQVRDAVFSRGLGMRG
jgi:8-oxo-dGTP diphosphatase